MNFVRSLSSAGLIWTAAALISSVSGAALAQAQQPPGRDVQDSQNALQFLEKANYPEAIKLYEGIPKNYPTSPLIPEANFRLGYIYFLTGEYQKGVSWLDRNIKGKNIPPEILELSYSFVPQILSAKAAKLASDAPERKGAFLEAIKQFDAFIQKFPKSEEVESANYGKARAFYSIQQYSDAAPPLRDNLKNYPQSPSALDTEFMLALVLGTEANVANQKSAKDPVATTDYDEAGKYLGDIIRKGSDVALANDAQFQLGEMMMARGSFEEKEMKEQVLQRALSAYRAVLPKELVIKAQQDRLAQIQAAKTNALKAGDVAQFKRLQRFMDKEQEKAAGLNERHDQTIPSRVKMGQIFLSLEKFDETRVLLRFVEPLVEDPEQKKQAAYFIALTYAAQNLAEKAVEHYDKFMAAHPNDPIAENLPLLVGLSFLAKSEPDKALKYFDEQVKLYPKSKFTADAVMRQALALIPLERYDEAAGVLVKFLAGSPTPEQAAAADFGLGTIYQKTGKVDEAVKTFKEVRDKFAGSAEAEQATFWVGQMTLGKGDAKTAQTELKTFVDKFPKSELVPAAMLALGQAQAAAGDKAGAINAYKALADKFPESEPAPIAFFQIASLYQKESQFKEVKDIMKEFVAKYPESDRLYAAYDYVAQIQVTEKVPMEAVATYEEFLKKRPADPDGAKAYVKISNHWKKYGEEQGPYLALNETQRTEWRKGVENAVLNAEKVLEKFPEGAEVSSSLQTLLACQKLMQRAKIKTEKEVDEYFRGFARKFSTKPATMNKIQFAYAAYVAEKDEVKAFEIMKNSYDSKLIYAPADLDLWGAALIKKKKLDEAQKVYEKLATDYPVPAGVAPEKAPSTIKEAQSMALFGFAKVLQDQGKTAEAGTKFAELKVKFPSSAKLMDAEYGIAEDEVRQQKYKEALERLGPIVRNPNAPANLRAKGMMLIGRLSEESGDLDTAINNYIKIGTLFPAEAELAPEGLWRGAQAIEKKLSK